MARNNPPRAEGHATIVDTSIQRSLPFRTFDKLNALTEGELSDHQDAALTVLLEAFREANCHASLFDVTLWDLAGNVRIQGMTGEDISVVIPCDHLPAVGSIINWENQTYYIASHKEPT